MITEDKEIIVSIKDDAMSAREVIKDIVDHFRAIINSKNKKIRKLEAKIEARDIYIIGLEKGCKNV